MTQTPVPTQREALTQQDREAIASILTWRLQNVITSCEVITLTVVKDVLWIKLTRNRSIPIELERFKELCEQMEYIDAEVVYVMALEKKLQEYTSQEPWIEVDSVAHGVYRVWKGIELLGTFYEYEGAWIAEPAYGEMKYCASSDAAQKVIAQQYLLRVA